MKILNGNRQIIALVGLNAVPSTLEDKRIRIRQIITRLVIVAAFTLWIAGHIIDITKLVEKDFVAVLFPIYLALIFGCILVTYLCLLGTVKQIHILIEYLENFVNNRRKNLHILKVQIMFSCQGH